MKSCTSGHSFLQQEFVLGLMAFMVFYNNNGILNGIFLPDFQDVLSGFYSIVLTILSIEYHVQ